MKPFHLISGALFALTLAGCVDTGTTSSSASYDRRVNVINATNMAIVNFYGSNTGTASWEEDILGTSYLPSGSAVVINFDDGTGYCDFDFKVVFEDGSSEITTGVNVCSISSYTISN